VTPEFAAPETTALNDTEPLTLVLALAGTATGLATDTVCTAMVATAVRAESSLLATCTLKEPEVVPVKVLLSHQHPLQRDLCLILVFLASQVPERLVVVMS
jgi:hypothetical protein